MQKNVPKTNTNFLLVKQLQSHPIPKCQTISLGTRYYYHQKSTENGYLEENNALFQYLSIYFHILAKYLQSEMETYFPRQYLWLS